MCPHLTDVSGHHRQQKQGCQCSYTIVNGEHNPHPIAAFIICGRRWLAGTEGILGNNRRRVDPHDEQSRPAKKLRQRQLFHDVWHAGKITDNLAQHVVATAILRKLNGDDAS